MTLRVRRKSDVNVEGIGAQGEGDGWGARLAKLIPAEALGLYGAAASLVPAASAQLPLAHRRAALWAVVAICLAFSAAIRWKSTSTNGSNPQILAIVISLISFLVWLMALGAPASPVALPEGYGFIGPLVAVLWATVVSYFYRGDAP